MFLDTLIYISLKDLACDFLDEREMCKRQLKTSGIKIRSEHCGG